MSKAAVVADLKESCCSFTSRAFALVVTSCCLFLLLFVKLWHLVPGPEAYLSGW